MSFLGDLADAISSQFSLGENTTTSLDAEIDGQQVKYGSLGDFASQFDQSAERKYVEEGYLRRDPYNTDPKQFEILWQEPHATVLIKKRMFSSIAENYRPDFMDSDEKLYYKAMRILFQNKCRQISALEKLSKIQKITSAVGDFSSQLVPVVISLTDAATGGVFNSGSGGVFGGGNNLFGALGGGSNPFTTQDGSAFVKTVDRLRTLYAYNTANPYTTWITDPTDIFQSVFGSGTGVMELTNFTNIDTSTSVDARSPGNFSLKISDPYESMLITDYDIEIALSDATNLFYNSKSFQFGIQSSNQIIADQQSQLNAIRGARNASPITFKVDPDTLLSKRVIAIIDRIAVEIPFQYDPTGGTGFPGLGGFGNSVSVPDDYLRGGNVAGYDGLDTAPGYTGYPWTKSAHAKSHGNSELDAFNAIITAIFSQLQLMANAAGNFTTNNKSYNYARKKLRFNFSGKLIIQPMDVAHIYMNSKSQADNKILSGLTQMFSGFGILQNINNTLTGLKNATDILFNPSQNISIQAEKSMYVGPNFPNYLWSVVRTQFVTEKEGTHVFGGVVKTAADNWSNGQFSIDVSGDDNTFYFQQGKVNFKPGADAFNGLMFDPLTPFKSNFDSVTINAIPGSLELLDENKYLLSETGKDSLAKYKQGSLAGEKATQANYIQDQSIDANTGRLTRVFYAPDGLVYKWKQGIGVFTQAGSTNTLNDPNLVGSPNIYNEPFAGLDVMNVLSLLITGIPYNFATYYKSTANLNGFSGDPQSKQSSSHSFINSLRNTLTKNNSLWGNFIPFKNLTMNNSAIAQAMQLQFTISNANSDLDRKLKKLSDLQRESTTLGAVNALSTKIPNLGDPTLASHIQNVESQISSLTDSINASISSAKTATAQFFNQVDMSAAYNSNYLIDGKNNPSDDSARKLIRKQTNYLTRRMSYDVRGNSDKNLLIVDDYYDIDYDIAAFNKSLSKGIELYSTEYTNVSTKIQNVADLLNLEVFCDSQGHIRIRPPQYNRMPSSVFNRMIYLKHALGVQVFPQFLNTLFTDQLTTLKNRIEIIEDKIRLDCAIIGQYPTDAGGDAADITAQTFISFAGVDNGKSNAFSFISNSTGVISNYSNLIKQANQDAVTGSIDQSTSAYAKIAAAGTSTRQLFSNSERYIVLAQVLQSQKLQQGSYNVGDIPSTSIFQDKTVQALIDRIQIKSGQYITSQDYVTSPGPNQPLEVDTGQTIDFFKVTEELTTFIQEWQAAVKLFYHTIKNTAELKSLDDDSTTSNSLLNPGLFNNSYIPEVYEHMIEDESYDDYGPGSGTRYVIKRSQIKSIRIAENAPDYTAVQAQGTLPFFQENEGPPGLNSFPNGGNALVTAMAFDYDMWRNYGYKEPYVVKVPFLSDPVTQLGPYASMILTRNRSNILRGSLTITGNEYMQPGEVIYLEDRNLLFYVSSVKHSYSEGSSFNTTLDLTYGHSIGEYIPTYVDTIGKLIYKNQETAATVIQRQDSSAPEENLGVVQRDGRNPNISAVSSGNTTDNSTSSYATTNSMVINNILYNTQYMINSNNTAGNNVKASIELRLYYNNQKGGVDFKLSEEASKVKALLLGTGDGPQTSIVANQPVQNAKLPSGSVNIVTVNIDDPDDRRSPSQKAIDAARNQMATVSTNTGSAAPSNPTGNDDGTDAAAISANNNALKTALFSYIIDCWISFTTTPANIASNSSADSGF